MRFRNSHDYAYATMVMMVQIVHSIPHLEKFYSFSEYLWVYRLDFFFGRVNKA